MYQLGHVSHKTCHKIILYTIQYATVEARNKSLVEILWGSYTSRIPSSLNGCGSRGSISRFKRCFTLPNPSILEVHYGSVSKIPCKGFLTLVLVADVRQLAPSLTCSPRCRVPALASPRRGHDLPPPSRASVSRHSGRTWTFSARAWDG